jgi:hypothetical protein
VTKERIAEEAKAFFYFPTEKRETVTLTSCLIFAKVISDMAVEEFKANAPYQD